MNRVKPFRRESYAEHPGPAGSATVPRQLTVQYKQIQYTQTVFLNFATLTWPHVSVNTLVPGRRRRRPRIRLELSLVLGGG